MLFDTALSGLQARVAILESVVEILSGLLAPPKLFVSEVVRGFRYENPDVRHFCLLKAVRAVSALNAATQELAVLMRIVTECTKHIEYVLDMDDTEEHRSNVKTYLREFFEDIRREPGAEIKGVLIREERVNEQLGKTLDRISKRYGDTGERVPAAQLFYRSSRAFSFYVHARYPEAMDLYGGSPGRWHLRGMGQTPKDSENLEILDTFITTASTTFVIMVQGIPQLLELVLREPTLRQWYAESVGRIGPG